MNIRKARETDLSRIAEIFVFNNRLNYLPIFKDPQYSFGELQVVSVIDNYFGRPEILDHTFVYDDGLIKGFLQTDHQEIKKLYTDPFFQSQGIGNALIQYAVKEHGAACLWALEKNTRALSFYARHGFMPTGRREFEEGTEEYLVELKGGQHDIP